MKNIFFKYLSFFIIFFIISGSVMADTYYTPAWQGDTKYFHQFGNNYYYIPKNITDKIYLNLSLNTIYYIQNITVINGSLEIYDNYSNYTLYTISTIGTKNIQNFELIVKADNTTLIYNTIKLIFNYTATNIILRSYVQITFHSWTADYLGASEFQKSMQNVSYIIVALLMLFIFISIILYIVKVSRGEE